MHWSLVHIDGINLYSGMIYGKDRKSEYLTSDFNQKTVKSISKSKMLKASNARGFVHSQSYTRNTLLQKNETNAYKIHGISYTGKY